MHSASLDLCGCRVDFRSADRATADWIAADFSGFSAPAAPGGPALEISALRLEPQLSALPPAVFRTKKWHLLASPPGRRLVWYPEGALCFYDYTTGEGRITSGSPDLLRELSYLLILSRAGEELDRRGLHRLHAGALTRNGKALLFCGPQGSGKTTLLLELLRDPDFALLSDDTPLVSRTGDIHPFPARVGLGEENPHLSRFAGYRLFHRRHYRPKRLISPAEAGAVCRSARPPSMLFRLIRGRAPAIRRGSPAGAASELARSLAAGIGVPQMAEYFIRLSPRDAARKSGILASRLLASFSLLRRASFWVFETGPDPARNAEALRAFLRSGSAGASPS